MSLIDFFKSLLKPVTPISLPVVPTSVVQAVIAPVPSRGARTTCSAGVELIQQFEGLSLTAYPDPASPLYQACQKNKTKISLYNTMPGWEKLDGKPWTIGWGHTGPDVVAELVWTVDQANQKFKDKLKEFEKQVIDLTGHLDLSDNQFGALVSFCYNVGAGNLKNLVGSSSTLEIMADKMLDYNRARGVVLPGLMRRREAERQLFLKG